MGKFSKVLCMHKFGDWKFHNIQNEKWKERKCKKCGRTQEINFEVINLKYQYEN